MLQVLSEKANRILRNYPGLYWKTRFLLERSPRFYLAILKVLYRQYKWNAEDWIVTPKTDIVIEGYPRSANSFALEAFIAAQKKGGSSKEPKIATHLHSPAQIVMASKFEIPSLVLIRKPLDAISSWRAYELENLHHSATPQDKMAEYDIKIFIKYYIWFYKRIFPYRDCFVLAHFDQVTKDFGSIIHQINNQFNTTFQLFEHSDDNVKTIFQRYGRHLSPSPLRSELKPEIKKKVQKYDVLLSEANDLYNNFLRSL